MTNTAPSGRAVRLAMAAYRALMHAYPSEFRNRFGVELEQVFGEAAREAHRQGGLAGLVRLGSSTLADLLTTAAAERISAQKAAPGTKPRDWFLAGAAVLGVFVTSELLPYIPAGLRLLLGLPIVLVVWKAYSSEKRNVGRPWTRAENVLSTALILVGTGLVGLALSGGPITLPDFGPELGWVAVFFAVVTIGFVIGPIMQSVRNGEMSFTSLLGWLGVLATNFVSVAVAELFKPEAAPYVSSLSFVVLCFGVAGWLTFRRRHARG